MLIYRLGSLGDTVVALPSYHLLARRFPDAERVLLTNFPVNAKAPAAAAVLGESGLVHRFMRYTVGTRKFGELLRLALEIRRFKPDLLVYMMDLRSYESIRRDRIFFRLAGIRQTVGFPAAVDLERRLDGTTGLYEQEAFRLARLIGEVGDAHAKDPANWDLSLTVAEREVAADALSPLAGRPLIVCGPATKMQAKDWGQENWRELLRRLYQEYPEYGLVLVGAQADAEFSEYAAGQWLGPKVNLGGQMSPRQTAAVLAGAEVFLGPDSGPMHLAASFGVPCVIAFSAHGLPGVWFPVGDRHQIVYHRPECFNCGLETCIEKEKICMRSITVDEMEQAVGRVLGRAVQV